MRLFHWPHGQAVHLAAIFPLGAMCAPAAVGSLVNSVHVLAGMLAAMTLAWGAFFISAGMIRARRLGIFTIIVWGLVFRLPAFFTETLLEDDHYRFLWDGLMLANGENPYAEAPMAFFDREDLGNARQWILSNINHPDLPTIYGLFAQLLFALSQWLDPGGLLGLRLLIIAADIFAAVFLFRHAGWRAALFWFWCPLLIKEGTFNAHFESVAIALALSAIYVAQRRPWLAGVLFSCAVATRPFALLLGPFVLFGNSRRKILGGEISFAIALLALHAPFGFGQVVGSLRTFAGEWEFNSSVFALLKIAFGLTAARVICLLLLVVVCVVIYWGWFFSVRIR